MKKRPFYRAVLLAGVLALLLQGVLMPAPPAAAFDDGRKAVEAKIGEIADRYGAVGVQVAVIRGGRVSDVYAWGWATKKTDPMTVDHKIRVASISKVIVTMAAMSLWDQGVVSPQTELGTCWGVTVRNPRYSGTPIILGNIMTHTSSLSGSVSLKPAGITDGLAKGRGFSSSRPGDIGSFYYNNTAFGLLGMTLEHITGRYLNDIMDEAFFEPLGIDASFSSGDVEATDKLATIYLHSGSVGRSVRTLKNTRKSRTPGTNGAYFAGGFTASAKDLAKLIAILAGDGYYNGTRYLSDRSVKYMEASVGIAPGGFYQCHPMRFLKDLFGRECVYYHTGNAYGAHNLACYDCVTGDGVVVLTTGASGKTTRGIYSVCYEIADYILRLPDAGQ